MQKQYYSGTEQPIEKAVRLVKEGIMGRSVVPIDLVADLLAEIQLRDRQWTATEVYLYEQRAEKAERELFAFKEENAYLLDKLSPMGRDFDPVKERDAAYDLGRRDGMEEAAKIAVTYSNQWENDNITAVIATAIRMKLAE